MHFVSRFIIGRADCTAGTRPGSGHWRYPLKCAYVRTSRPPHPKHKRRRAHALVTAAGAPTNCSGVSTKGHSALQSGPSVELCLLLGWAVCVCVEWCVAFRAELCVELHAGCSVGLRWAVCRALQVCA